MGFLTTITYSNDASDAFEKNPERMAEIVTDAIAGTISHFDGRSYNNSEQGLEELRNRIRMMPSESFDNPTAKVAKIKEIRAWTGKDLKDAVAFLDSM